MRFHELMQGLEEMDLLVFDGDALIVYQNGPLHKDDIVIELLPILKEASRLELFTPEECQVTVQEKRILLRKIGEFTLAVFMTGDSARDRFHLDAIRAFHRLKPELR